MDNTTHWAAYLSLAIFSGAYLLVIGEEFLKLRKSIPVVLAAGLIWSLVAWQLGNGLEHGIGEQVRHYLVEFGELFLFLLVAMTYVNSLSERGVFEALRTWLIHRQFSYRALFWITGILSFLLSPFIDNLTTALVMSAVIVAVGDNDKRFICLACVNIVVGANAGGAFSPFGDITTLMVWQRGIVDFQTFFALFLPSLVNFLVPALVMSFAVRRDTPSISGEYAGMKRGSKRIIALFACTILTAILFHNFLHLPPFLGMMTGLGYLSLFGFYLSQTHVALPTDRNRYPHAGEVHAFDSFHEISRAEWDTLLFFFGVILCVGALSFIGYLTLLSGYFYTDLGPTTANILVGIVSAIVDNIPVMVAVLEMRPEMDLQQWLLVTLTAGAGGSMLSIGSAAGVALMGQARGLYTFFGHLKWTPVIALGYGLSIWLHLLLSERFVGVMP